MRRSAVAAIAITVALAGCPLPQPLPTYPAGTVTPPRILSDTTSSGVESILLVPANCPTPPAYELNARIFYQTSETVEARWFVDYRTDIASRNTPRNTNREVPADPDPLVLERQVPAYTFLPYGFSQPPELGSLPANGPGVVHVVELVVSNGFDPSPTAPQPYRSPAVTADGATLFEIQTYRWVFVTVPESGTCAPGAPGCCPAPPTP